MFMTMFIERLRISMRVGIRAVTLLCVLAAGLAACSGESGEFDLEEVSQPVVVPPRVCDIHPNELRIFASYQTSACSGAGCMPICGSSSPPCPAGSTCQASEETGDNRCQPSVCSEPDDAACTGDTRCNLETRRCEWLSCADDSTCPCGSYCDGTTRRCQLNCFGGPDSGSLGLTCNGTLSCDGTGRCSSSTGIPIPPLEVTLAATPSRLAVARVGGAWPTVNTVVSLRTVSPATAALPPPAVRVVPSRDLLADCDQVGELSSSPCTISGAGWSYVRQDRPEGPIFVASRVVRVSVTPGSERADWTLGLATVDGALSTTAEIGMAATHPQDGRYTGSVVLGPGSPSTRLPIEATVTATAIALHDATRVIAPTGTVLVPRDGSDAVTSFLGGSQEPELYEQHVAKFRRKTLTFDAGRGVWTGEIGVRLASSPQQEEAWTFELIRREDLKTAPPCPSGEVLDATLLACIPGAAWDPAPDQPSSLVLAGPTKWLHAMAPRVADPLLTADTAAGLAERLVCFEQGVSSNAGFLNQTSAASGDQACAGSAAGSAHGWWAVGLASYQDRRGAAPPITQPEMLAACLQQITRAAPATVAAGGIANDSCVSLARFYPALFTAAGTAPYRFQGVAGQNSGSSRLLLSRLLQQWSQLTGFLARNGAAQRGAADLLSLVSQYTPGDVKPAEASLLSQSTTLSYESILDTVDAAWAVVLDKRIQEPLIAMPSHVVRRPDYRIGKRPLANWTLLPMDLLAGNTLALDVFDPGSGRTLTASNCTFGQGDASNFIGHSLIGNPSCRLTGQPRPTEYDRELTIVMKFKKALTGDTTTHLFDTDGILIRQAVAYPPPSAPMPALLVGHRTSAGTIEWVTFHELFGLTFDRAVLAIRRDTRTQTYTVGVGNDPAMTRTKRYTAPPSVRPTERIHVGSAREGAAAPPDNLNHVAMWDSVLSDQELQGVIARMTNPESSLDRDRPAWRVVSLPPAADPNRNEPTLGLPAAWLEGLIPTMNLVEAYVRSEMSAIQARCRRGDAGDEFRRISERAARTLRRGYAIAQLARALRDTAGTAPPWGARYDLAAAELAAARARAVDALTGAAECRSSMGLDGNEFPLYFATADTSAPSNLFTASSTFLKDLAGNAGPPAIGAIGAAAATLAEARNAWRAQYTSAIQDVIGDQDDARRIAGIRSSFGSELVDLCGVTGESASVVLERFLDPNHARRLTPQSCHIRETAPCRGSEAVPLDQVDPACFRGEIGESWIAALEASKRVTRAEAAAKAASDIHQRWLTHCTEKDTRSTGTTEMLIELEGYQLTESKANNLIAGLNGEAQQVSGYLTLNSGALNAGVAAVNLANWKIENKIEERRSELRNLLQAAGAKEEHEECWNQEKLANVPLEGAEQDVKLAGVDLVAALARVQTLQSRASARAIEAQAALAREAAVTRPRLAFHYWADEALELYQRRMARARRMTYLYLRAVEHDLQRSFDLDAVVLDAAHPQQLHDIAVSLGDELTHGMEQRRPERSFKVLSLCEDVLRLPELFDELDCNGDRSARRFREIVFAPANAVYEEGEYLGQSIPLRLTPELVNLTTRCAERLAEVDAHVVGEFNAGLVTVKLAKRETFFSETCRDHVADIGPVQEGTLHSSNNLLRGGEASAFSRDREWTRVQINAGSDATDRTFETRGPPGEHASAGLAGRGLYGDYMLIVPSAALAQMISSGDIRDIKLRFDFVSIEDNGPVPPLGRRQLAIEQRDGNGAALPGGTGNRVDATCVSCEVSSTATVTAVPASGWRFGGWGGACTGSASTCEVKMSNGRTVWATFVDERAVELRVSSAGTGVGGVAVGWPGAGAGAPTNGANLPSLQRVPPGTTVSLTASPAPDSTFTGWSGAGCSGTGGCTLTTGSGAVNVVASFARKPLLSINIDVGRGMHPYGTATVEGCNEPSCTFPSGDMILNPLAVPGWRLMMWHGDCDQANPPPHWIMCRVVMTQNRTVTAVLRFHLRIPIATHVGGTIHTSPQSLKICDETGCWTPVEPGREAVFIAFPNPGFEFLFWTGAASRCGSDHVCFVAFDAAEPVSAVFRRF